jgi:hypothetical protein
LRVRVPEGLTGQARRGSGEGYGDCGPCARESLSHGCSCHADGPHAADVSAAAHLLQAAGRGHLEGHGVQAADHVQVAEAQAKRHLLSHLRGEPRAAQHVRVESRAG